MRAATAKAGEAGDDMVAHPDVDLVAVRLPSVTAMLATTLLIYAYARSWMSRLGSFSSAAMFATFGQVLGIGRFG